jgi:FkbM family methyltransferase
VEVRKLLQGAGLLAYRALAKSGVLSNGRARGLFLKAYALYKRVLEAGPVDELRRFVDPGTVVVDVGANVGFFTLSFAEWVGPTGRVIAVEPDRENFEALERAIADSGKASRVGALRAVAAEKPGSLFLERNELHPGDHKIAVAGAGIEVAAVSIDALVAETEPARVSLIKIDVQGAEMKVLAGAARALAVHRPALFVEIDERALRHFGASPDELVSFLENLGYRMHRLCAGGATPVLDRGGLRADIERRGYVDVLFLLQSPGFT